MTKTAIEMVIEEYEGHLERLIKQRSQRFQNGQGGSVPMIDRRIAEYQEIIARLKAPSVIDEVIDTLNQWIDQRVKQRKTETRSYLIDRSDSAIGTLNSVISLLKRIKNRKSNDV